MNTYILYKWASKIFFTKLVVRTTKNVGNRWSWTLQVEQKIKIFNSKLVNKNSPNIIIKYQIQVYLLNINICLFNKLKL